MRRAVIIFSLLLALSALLTPSVARSTKLERIAALVDSGAASAGRFQHRAVARSAVRPSLDAVAAQTFHSWSGYSIQSLDYSHRLDLAYAVVNRGINTFPMTVAAFRPSDPAAIVMERVFGRQYDQMVTSCVVDQPGQFLYVAVQVQGEYESWQIVKANASTLDTVARWSWPYPILPLDTDASGKVLYTTVQLSHEIVAVSTSSGQRVGVYNSSAMAQVSIKDAVVHPSTGDFYIVDPLAQQVFAISHTDGRLLGNVSVVANWMYFGSIAMDHEAQFLYTLTVEDIAVPHFRFTTSRISVEDLRLTSSHHWDAPQQYLRDLIAAGPKQGEFLAYDSTTFRLLHFDGEKEKDEMLGVIPPLPLPSTVRVGPGGDVYVGLGVPFAVVQMDKTGRFKAMFPEMLGSDWLDCPALALIAVAIDDSGLLYVTRCNGTIQVYDQQQALVRNIITGNLSTPTSVSLGRNGSLYYTDAFNGSQIFRLDHDGRLAQTFTSPDPDTVFSSAAFDASDASVWAVDYQLRVWHFDADGGLLSRVGVNASEYTQLVDIAVDAGNRRLLVLSTLGDFVGVTSTGTWLLTFDMDSARLLGNLTIPTVALGVGVAIDPETGRVYVADDDEEQVVYFDPEQAAAAVAEMSASARLQ